jgi:hypothetical protein
MKYYSATKINEETTKILISEKGQVQKVTYDMILFYEVLRIGKF